MSLEILPAGIEEYAARHSFPEGKVFRALAEATLAKTSMPQMQVGRLEGAFLRLLVRLSDAKRVLEIGTFTGYSALAMAEALPDDGRVVTCDVDPEATAIAREHWGMSAHGKKIELRLGPALETLASEKGPFDLVFIDADKENYPRYWELAHRLLRAGGLVVVDNALWSGRVLSPSDEEDVAIAETNRLAAHDPRFETVLLTVRDGMLLGWKKA